MLRDLSADINIFHHVNKHSKNNYTAMFLGTPKFGLLGLGFFFSFGVCTLVPIPLRRLAMPTKCRLARETAKPQKQKHKMLKLFKY